MKNIGYIKSYSGITVGKKFAKAGLSATEKIKKEYNLMEGICQDNELNNPEPELALLSEF